MDTTMEELENEVSNTVATISKNIYRNSSTRMLVWILENKPYLLTEEFIGLTSKKLSPFAVKKTVKSLLDGAPLHEPLKWHLFMAPEFMTCIASLKKPEGEKPGYLTYNTHRAALFNLFRDYK